MSALAIKKSGNKISLEIDRDKLESLMASLGILSDKALEKVKRADEDYRKSRYEILRNQKDLLKLSKKHE